MEKRKEELMNKCIVTGLCLLFVVVLSAPALGSPALPITKPPVQPNPSWTGPTVDPHAVQGQWFKDLTTQKEEYRPYEFYDNRVEHGGSAWKSTLAIEGYVQNIVYDVNGNITGFGIQATITNDDPGIVGDWEEAYPGNLHDEWVTSRDPYMCTMFETKLTVEFADDGTQGNLPVGGVYLPEQNIYAIDYDELGWYCWTPENPDPCKAPWGDYMVPTYDFGDIDHYESVTRDLSFGLYVPEDPCSTLFAFLEDAQLHNWDVFMNRTTSLKISQYVENLLYDDGTAYPAPPHNSDVSVFFIPEPTSLALLVVGGLAFRRRKR
jgi:hypothetical protein